MKIDAVQFRNQTFALLQAAFAATALGPYSFSGTDRNDDDRLDVDEIVAFLKGQFARGDRTSDDNIYATDTLIGDGWPARKTVESFQSYAERVGSISRASASSFGFGG